MSILPCSYLFAPADRPERFAKALGSGADRIITDLEDAVRPEAKPAARRALGAAEIDWERVVIRVNDAGSPFWDDDLAVVGSTSAAAVMVPKAESADALGAVRDAAGRAVEIIPQIETAAGLAGVESLSRVPGVRRCAFGHLDFALDLGCSPEWEALLMARSELVFRSRLAGLQASVDSVTPDIAERSASLREAERARRLGFGGKLLIHPDQVVPVHQALAPSEDEIAWAERVLAAETSAGAIRLDGKMVDRPVIEAARSILRRSRIPKEG